MQCFVQKRKDRIHQLHLGKHALRKHQLKANFQAYIMGLFIEYVRVRFRKFCPHTK